MSNENKQKPSFQDNSLATKTEWSPMVPGGIQSRTRNLIYISDHRLEFVASGSSIWSAIGFLSVGLIILITAIIGLDGTPDSKGGIILSAICGLPLIVLGAWTFFYTGQPIVFDTSKELFWFGVYPPKEVDHVTSCFLADVHAIQLIEEWVKGSKSVPSYYSYELNLVLNSGKRIHIIDHGKLTAIRKDANHLAKFLNIPLWDNTQG